MSCSLEGRRSTPLDQGDGCLAQMALAGTLTTNQHQQRKGCSLSLSMCQRVGHPGQVQDELVVLEVDVLLQELRIASIGWAHHRKSKRRAVEELVRTHGHDQHLIGADPNVGVLLIVQGNHDVAVEGPRDTPIDLHRHATESGFSLQFINACPQLTGRKTNA